VVVDDPKVTPGVQDHQLMAVLQIEDRKSVIDPKGPIEALNDDT